MTVKDLQIDSLVYRVQLDSIEIARVRLIEAFNDGTRKIELNNSHHCVTKTDVSEIKTESKYCTYTLPWYLNIEDAELAQLMLRAEHIKKLKKEMEMAQNAFADAIQKYAFAEPSQPTEM